MLACTLNGLFVLIKVSQARSTVITSPVRGASYYVGYIINLLG